MMISEVLDDRHRVIGFRCEECKEQSAYMQWLIHKENCPNAKCNRRK